MSLRRSWLIFRVRDRSNGNRILDSTNRSESARSARQHEARGVSPGNRGHEITKPAMRATDLMIVICAEIIHWPVARLNIGTICVEDYRPLRGLDYILVLNPGAHAPGFTLMSAPRTENKMVCPHPFQSFSSSTTRRTSARFFSKTAKVAMISAPVTMPATYQSHVQPKLTDA